MFSQERVAHLGSQALENVYGTKYKVGSPAQILCKLYFSLTSCSHSLSRALNCPVDNFRFVLFQLNFGQFSFSEGQYTPT